MKTTQCERCGITFGFYRSKTYNDARFCSKKCWAQKKKTAKCMRCEKEFSFWETTRPRAAYCSRLCQNTIQAQRSAAFLKERNSRLTENEKLELLKSAYEKHVIRSEGCWDWSADKSAKYGKVHFMGRSIMAHRASYMIHKGKIGTMNVLHACDNPPCTNPEHLFLGTYLDNNRDRIKKGRSNTAKGEKTRHAKLTEIQVIEIRRLLSMDVMAKRIAKDFGVKPMTISDIKLGKSWSHIK